MQNEAQAPAMDEFDLPEQDAPRTTNRTLTLGRLLGSVPALNHLMTLEVTASLSFRLARVYSEISPIATEGEKQRIEVCKKHGGVIEDEQYVFEDQTKAEAEIKELLDTEVSVNVLPIKIESFGATKIMPQVLVALDWLIVE